MGRVSIALVPFWRLDAKGGEVVLLGCFSGFAREGISIRTLLCVLYAYAHVSYFPALLLWQTLCVRHVAFHLWCETYGIMVFYLCGKDYVSVVWWYGMLLKLYLSLYYYL